jgi:hypothetical protein
LNRVSPKNGCIIVWVSITTNVVADAPEQQLDNKKRYLFFKALVTI